MGVIAKDFWGPDTSEGGTSEKTFVKQVGDRWVSRHPARNGLRWTILMRDRFQKLSKTGVQDAKLYAPGSSTLLATRDWSNKENQTLVFATEKRRYRTPSRRQRRLADAASSPILRLQDEVE